MVPKGRHWAPITELGEVCLENLRREILRGLALTYRTVCLLYYDLFIYQLGLGTTHNNSTCVFIVLDSTRRRI